MEAKKIKITLHNKIEMPPEDILHLADTVEKKMGGNINDPIWRKAFTLYNLKNKNQLSLFCSPCYNKVLQYFMIEGYKKMINEKNQ